MNRREGRSWHGMTITGLLLVGGLSRRMGRDKASLVVGGLPLWARQLSLLREIKADAIWISARVRPDWAPADVEVLLDTPPSRGPLSGIALALTTMTTSHLLALAVDLPQLTAEYVEKLVALTPSGKGVVPYNEGREEPLTALYPKQAAGLALEALASEDVSLRSFVRKLRLQNLLVEYRAPPEERILHRNLNTPEDLAD
jgi:molybdopterin-guanine dinucleotide biosynthesis protein A